MKNARFYLIGHFLFTTFSKVIYKLFRFEIPKGTITLKLIFLPKIGRAHV